MSSSSRRLFSKDFLKRLLKSLTAGAVVTVVLLLAFLHIRDQTTSDGIPSFLRANLEWNGKIWSRLFNVNRSPPHRRMAAGARLRVNGDLGLGGSVDQSKWRLQVFVEDQLVQTLPMAGLRWLPHTNTATEFYCVEGWSTQFSYSGIKFADFMKGYGLSTQYQFVGLETPDEEYYVSVDMESMLHPQTLLADEMNERPLSIENGAPLRLVIPIKYGIKSLKRIGSIHLSNTRPPDYWAERGYDWYAGL